MSFYDNYDARRATALRTKIQQRYYRRLFSAYGLTLNADTSFVDIGPGTGTLAHVVREHGVQYLGIEPNEGLVEELRAQGFEIQQGLVPPISREDETVDIVFSSHVIEHLPNPETVFEFFQESYRVLKPGGRVVCIAPDYRRMGKYFWDSDYTHTFPVTRRRIEQLVCDTEFQVQVLEEVTEPLISWEKWLVAPFLTLYPYGLLEAILPVSTAKRIAFKLRSTFAEAVLLIAEKPSQKHAA